MGSSLTTEIIEAILDEVCHEFIADTCQQPTLSSLALVCTLFRQRINYTRFRSISFEFRTASLYALPSIRLAKLEDLFNEDERLCSQQHAVDGNGGDVTISKSVVSNVKEFSVDITGASQRHVYPLLARIMGRLFRGTRPGTPDADDCKNGCKFMLFYDATNHPLRGKLLDWPSLGQDFEDAFALMCTTSRLNTLSLTGCRRIPTSLFHNSTFRRLIVDSVSFDGECSSDIQHATTEQNTHHLGDLVMLRLASGKPDQNMIQQVASLSTYLWKAEEMSILQDLLGMILNLKTLRIYLKFKLEGPMELITFNPDLLPHLQALSISVDMHITSPSLNEVLPLSFILGTNTPPEIRSINISLKVYCSPNAPILESFQETLDNCNLSQVDQTLLESAQQAPELECVVFHLYVRHASFLEMDTHEWVQFTINARHFVVDFLPLIAALKKIRLEIEVDIDEEMDEWNHLGRRFVP